MRVNEYFNKVVVINLDRRTDRMEKLVPQLEELGIQYERHSAIDGKELGISPITAGTMSHQKVLEKNIEKRILILEDDAQFVDNFNEKFEEVMQTLPADSDIFYLGALLPKNTGKVEDLGNKYWFKQIFSTGSHAYSIHPARVKYFAEKLKDYEWYIDIGLREFSRDYKAVIAQPNLVTQFPSYSDLRLEEVNDF
jgi:GR25 family glycosyltransferase involved in LPS biosynthesis